MLQRESIIIVRQAVSSKRAEDFLLSSKKFFQERWDNSILNNPPVGIVPRTDPRQFLDELNIPEYTGSCITGNNPCQVSDLLAATGEEVLKEADIS